MDLKTLRIQYFNEDGSGEFYLIDRDSIERIEFNFVGPAGDSEKPEVSRFNIFFKSGSSIELSPPFDRFYWSTDSAKGTSIESFFETALGTALGGSDAGSGKQ